MAEKKARKKTTKTAKKTTKAKPSKKTAKGSKAKSTKSKTTKSKKKEKEEFSDDMGIVIVEDDLSIDKDKVNEERKAYLEEARSQEAFD